MASNTPWSSAPVSSFDPSPNLPLNKNGKPWDPSKNPHLLSLARQRSVEYIQTDHYPTFTIAQLTELIAHTQAAKGTIRNQDTALDNPESGKAAKKTDSNEDEVIDSGFAQRRGNQPAWQGTTTKWESKGKPGIGWTPVSERPEMGMFLKDFKGPGDREGKGKGEGEERG
jgi:hypothetical protein